MRKQGRIFTTEDTENTEEEDGEREQTMCPLRLASTAKIKCKSLAVCSIT
jgi:hypothetical protein